MNDLHTLALQQQQRQKLSIHFAGVDGWLNLPYTTAQFNVSWVAAFRATQDSSVVVFMLLLLFCSHVTSQ